MRACPNFSQGSGRSSNENAKRPALFLLGGFLAVANAERAVAQTVEELYRQGVTARMEQRFEEALSLLERARALDPDNSDILVQIGFAQLALANNAAARQAFEQALTIAPSYEDARFGLAQIAFRSGDLAEARRLTETVLGAQPDNAEAMQLSALIEAAEKAEQVKQSPPGAAGARSAGDHAPTSAQTPRGRPLRRSRGFISRGAGAVPWQCRCARRAGPGIRGPTEFRRG